jgi:hypothetical protein
VATKSGPDKLTRRAVGWPEDYPSKKAFMLARRNGRKKIRVLREKQILFGRTEKHSSLYKPGFAQAARLVCSIYGSTIEELANYFNVTDGTIQRWMREHPEFYDAVHNQSSSANVRAMQRLYRRAMGFRVGTEKIFYDVKRGKVVRVPTAEYYPPSETAIFFWLKNRMPDKWKDVKEVNDSSGAPRAADIYQTINASVTVEQAADAYDKLLRIGAASTAEAADKMRKAKSPVTSVTD